MEFNDMVTTVVDQRERELREIEVLVKLVPFLERDVEERCAELDDAQAMADGIYLKDGEKADELKKEFLEDCERKKEREWERVVRLRRGILERAVRVFPELAAEEPQDSFRPVSAEAEPSFNAAENERDAQCVFSGEGDGCPPTGRRVENVYRSLTN